MGVLAGVSDYFIMRATGDRKGLWLEFKDDKNNPTKEQDIFLAKAREEGYQAKVVRSVKEAINDVVKYLEGEK